MIIPLTRHLLKLVEEDVSSWHIEPHFHLGLNVSAEHLQDSEFIADIRQFAANVAAHRFLITLELTERSLISEGPEVAQRLQQLRQEGIHIAIYDFGTGHCSLSYLQSFPLDYLKVDQGFVRTISSQEEETPILDTIISLAHRLNLKIVAEGGGNLASASLPDTAWGWLHSKDFCMPNPWIMKILPFGSITTPDAS